LFARADSEDVPGSERLVGPRGNDETVVAGELKNVDVERAAFDRCLDALACDW